MLTLTDGGEPDAGIAPHADRAAASRLPARSRRGRAPPARSPTRASRRCCIPRHAAELARRRADDAQTLAKLLLPGRDPRRDQGRAVDRRTASPGPSRSMLWRVKRAGRAHGATVNDVARAAVAGRDRVPPARARRPASTSCTRSSRSTCARSTSRCRASSATASASSCSGFPSGSPDPLERLAEVKRRMDAIKHSHEGASPTASWASWAARPQRRAAADRLLLGQGLDGPDQRARAAPAVYAGRHAARAASSSWAPCSGSVGMSVSVFSYAGKVTRRLPRRRGPRAGARRPLADSLPRRVAARLRPARTPRLSPRRAARSGRA